MILSHINVSLFIPLSLSLKSINIPLGEGLFFFFFKGKKLRETKYFKYSIHVKEKI